MGGPSYHHGDLRAAMIGAGLAILAEGGIEALGLRRAAARVGVSHTAPKNHFAGLRGLLTAIAAEGYWRLGQEMRQAAATASLVGVPAAIARAHARFADENPALFRLMTAPDRCDQTEAGLTEAADACFSVIRGATGDDGEASRLWALMQGHATLLHAGRLPPAAATTPPRV